MSIVLSCAFPVVNDHFVKSVAMAQSGGSAHYVRAHGEEKGMPFESFGNALDSARRMLSAPYGGAYVGLMGVPVHAAAKYDIGVNALLDPCTNVRIGTAILTDLETQCQSERADESVTCILERYAVMTERDPAVFTETVLYGAIQTPNVDGTFPGPAVAQGDRVFWESNSTKAQQNPLFFDVDIGTTTADSRVKTAKDLDE